MEIWQVVQFSACLLFFLLGLLCVRSLFYWLLAWHNVRNGWSKLKKTLFLPPSYQIHYQSRKLQFGLRDVVILALVVSSSYILYFDLLKVIIKFLPINDPQLLIVIFTFNLVLLYVMLPFLIAAFALIIHMVRKMMLLVEMALVFVYYQLLFGLQSYFHQHFHFPF